MKKGFTMIELIFVIVILGVLAAVAIPKLNATREDAEIAKASSNLGTLITDLSSYYTANGKLASTIGEMSRVGLDGNEFKVQGKNCLTMTLSGTTLTIQAAANLASSSAACQKFLALKSVQTMLINEHVCTAKTSAEGAVTTETVAGCSAAGDKVKTAITAFGQKTVMDFAASAVTFE